MDLSLDTLKEGKQDLSAWRLGPQGFEGSRGFQR